MSFFSIPNISIDGVCGVVPKNILHNVDYDYISEKERQFLIKTTGIARKRHVDKGVTALDLGERAAKELLDKLNWKKDEVDLLVLVTQSRDYYLPSSAIILQHNIGLSRDCMAFDVGLGCSGYIYGLSIIGKFLQSGQFKKALLIAGDVSSVSTHYEDKSTYPLFGDGVSATALSYSEGAPEMYFDIQNDGENHEAIIIRDGGAKNLFNEDSTVVKNYGEGINRSKKDLELNGLDVFSFSIKEPPQNIKRILERTSTPIESIDYFVFHQANRLIIETIRKKLKVPAEKVPYSLTDYGNTSSASIPLTICDQLKEGASNKRMLLCGFGVGLSWGSCIVDTKNILCLDPIEY
ncbi:MAG: ketoacyl-ACP synthase III [Flavobacteriales bacterium]|nr:ketoacyl-ACP synthase III [Flavobacteriales bacterium]